MLAASLLSLLLLQCAAIISPAEQAFICAYRNVPYFPVPCSNAANACNYAGYIRCQPQAGPNWTETITRLDLYIPPSSDPRAVLVPEIGNLKSLQYLFASGFYTGGSTIPTEIGLCTQLIIFDIQQASLQGTVPAQLLQNDNLFALRLNNNNLTGLLPSHLTELSFAKNLAILDLSGNQFTGPFPDPANMTLLIEYDVSNNLFEGPVPRGFNSNILNIVALSNCRANGTIPDDLVIQSSNYLTVSLKSNRLQGTIPTWFFTPELIVLDLSYNELSGTLPSEMALAVNLNQLVLTQNHLSGTIPTELDNLAFPFLFKLSMGHNNLTGSIPRLHLRSNTTGTVPGYISYYHGFCYLNLNDNQLSGVVPVFSNGSFSSPTSIDLSSNAALFVDSQSFGNGDNITWLNLGGNDMSGHSLVGSLFSDQTRMPSLTSLDLSYCRLTGTLPDMFRVQYLKLNNNFFTGSVEANLVDPQFMERLPVFIDLRLNRLDTEAEKATLFGSGSVDTSFNTEVVVKDVPQDFDECLSPTTNACQYRCVDGWFPIPGYTCDCPSGFQLDNVDKRSCHAVCGDGVLSYPSEQCDFVYSPVGCTFNCTQMPGYNCNETGCRAICGDGLVVEPEQCDGAPVGCTTTCTVEANYTCTNNVCQLCATEAWHAVQSLENTTRRQFPRFYALGYQTTGLPFTSCLQCSGGFSLQTRNVLSSVYCIGVQDSIAVECSYACSNLTIFSEADAALYTLKNQLEAGDFLNQILRRLFNLTAVITVFGGNGNNKRQTTPGEAQLSVALSSCDTTTDMAGLTRVLGALATDIVPNAPDLQARATPNSCRIDVLSVDPPGAGPFPIGITVGVALGVLALLALLVALISTVIWYTRSELHSLPSAISWSFLDKLTHPWRWQFHRSDKSAYYSRVYEMDSDEHERVEGLLASLFKKGPIRLGSITAVYNPALTVSFVNQWKTTTTRYNESPDHFFARTYLKDPNKMRVMRHYQENVLEPTGYNKKLVVPLIGALHGTDYTVAQLIAATGFAALSSLDAGFFGKGIYFTTHVLYTLPYCCGKRNPALVLSYINMVCILFS